MARLVPPHGGRGLRPLQVLPDDCAQELRRAQTLRKVRITSREKGDVVMLGMGGFTPLEGFMSYADWRRVCDDMHTASGVFWMWVAISSSARPSASWVRFSSSTSSAQEKSPITRPERSRCGRRFTEIQQVAPSGRSAWRS